MKTDIHPREVIFRDSITGSLIKIMSAAQTKETIEHDGQEYPLVRADISSTSHPFYTGQQRIVDTAGRVEKFGNKFGGGKLSGLLKKKRLNS